MQAAHATVRAQPKTSPQGHPAATARRHGPQSRRDPGDQPGRAVSVMGPQDDRTHSNTSRPQARVGTATARALEICCESREPGGVVMVIGTIAASRLPAAGSLDKHGPGGGPHLTCEHATQPSARRHPIPRARTCAWIRFASVTSSLSGDTVWTGEHKMCSPLGSSLYAPEKEMLSTAELLDEQSTLFSLSTKRNYALQQLEKHSTL